MDGIERIIEKIEADAEAVCLSVISEAEKEAKGIIDEAEASSGAEAHSITADAERQRDAMIKKAHLGGELMKKRKILSRKVEMIDGTVSKAVENFVRDEPAKYFDAMVRLAAKYALEGEQEMVFSGKDYSRIPADFEKRVNSAAGGRGKITVRDGGSFEGGFLLVGNDMVENCTLAALIGEAETEIKDELCRILFV